MKSPRHKFFRNLAIAVGVGIGAAALAGSEADPRSPAAGVKGGTAPGGRVPMTDAAGDPIDPPARPVVADLDGDAELAGALDLSKMELVDDHYEVPLPDGRRAVLTLDPVLQKKAEKVLNQAKAPRGAVVITATDGRILAYAGRRTEDPKGGKHGLVDYALLNTAWAPAASIFKIVSAAALVDAGVDPHAKVAYHGGLRSVMESNLADHRQDDRSNDLAYGLAHSQNAIIAKLAHQHLDPTRLTAMAATLGFGATGPHALSSWALGGEAGRCEIPAEKGVDFGKTAAGFKGAELSPVGGVLLANTIASGGMVVTPTIVAALIDGDRRIPVNVPAPRRAISADVAAAVGSMMVQTCDSGSAAKAFRGKGGLARTIKIAGKTGTLSRDNPDNAGTELEYSWFVGYAPADQPTMSIAVVLGNTDLWWLKSHTAARLLLADALSAKP